MNSLRIVCLGVLVMFSTASCALFNDNFKPVKSGAFYRSAQMSPGRLAWMTRKYGIRTVISLRGVSDGENWREDEVRVCEERGISHHDIPWSMSRIPDPESLRRFVEVCKSADGPILVHCQAGIHRAGTASAIYRLLQGESARKAKSEFGVYFHDAPIGKVVDLYDGSSQTFADWVEKDYPALYREHVTPATRN